MALVHIIYLSLISSVLLKCNDLSAVKVVNWIILIVLTITTILYLWYSGKMHLRFWVLWVSILVVFTLSMAAFFSNVKGHDKAAIGCGISSFILSCFCIGVWYLKGDTFDGSSLLSMKNRMEKKGRSVGNLFSNKETIQKNYTKRIQTKQGSIATAEHKEAQANLKAQEYRRQAQNETNPTLAKRLRQTADHHEREAYKHRQNKKAHQTDLDCLLYTSPSPRD